MADLGIVMDDEAIGQPPPQAAAVPGIVMDEEVGHVDQASGPVVGADGIEIAPLEPTEDSRWHAQQVEKLQQDQALAAQRAEQNAALAAGFKASLDRKPNEEAEIQALASNFKIPTRVAEVYKADLSAAWKASQFDPEAFRTAEPELARMLLEHPQLGATVHQDVPVSKLVKALRAAQDLAEDAQTAIQAALPQQDQKDLAPVAFPGFLSPIEVDRRIKAGPEAIAAERAKRDAPKAGSFAETPGAKEIREKHPWLAPFGRLDETWKDLEISAISADLGMRILAGSDRPAVDDLRRELLDKKLANVKQAYGEAGQGFAVDVLTGAASSAIALTGGYVAPPGARAVAATAAGAGAAAVVSRVPGGKYLVGAGLARGTFNLEFGSTFDESTSWRTEDGKPLSEKERAATAAGYAVLATGIEFGEFALLAGAGKAAGAVDGAAGKGALRAALPRLVKDPEFRAMVGKIATAWIGESGEESLQSLTQDAMQYLGTAKVQGFFGTHGVGNESVEKAVDAFGAAVPFGLTQSAGAAVVGRALGSISRDDNLTGNKQAEAVAGLKDSLTARGAPEAVASMVADTTAKTGNPVTHMYVDAEILGTESLFQGAHAEDGQKSTIDELLGPDGQRKLEDAIAIGGKVEIPMPLYLEKWAGTPTAIKLAEHTTTRAAHLTEAQLKADPGLIEEQAKKLVEEADAVQASNKESEKKFGEMEAELAQVEVKGRPIGKARAKATANLWRAVYRTTQAAFGNEVADQHLDEARVELAKGGPGISDSMLQGPLEDRALSDNAQQHAIDTNIDRLTNLRNFDAFQAQPRTPGKQVVALTVATIKPVNDAVNGGHDTANVILRHLAPIARTADEGAARKGTTFLLEGDQAVLDGTREAMQRALPPGMAIEGGIGADAQTAMDAMDATVDAKRLSGELPKERSQTKFDLSTLPAVEAQMAKTGLAAQNITDAMLAAAEKATPEEKLAAYKDKKNPGVLNEIGFEHAGEKAHVAAVDVRGLKEDFNEAFSTGVKGSGKWAGDLAIAKVLEVAVKLGGHAVDFAHLSGDEFAFKHDDLAQVQAFAEDLQAELLAHPVAVKWGAVTVFVPVQLRIGVGEKTYGAADRALNRAKSGEHRSDGSGPTAAVVARGLRKAQALASEPSAATARGARARGRGPAPEAFAGGSESGGRAAGEDRLPLTWFERDPRSPEEIADARGYIARMTKVPKREWAAKFLDFIIAGQDGKRPGRGGLSDEDRDEVRLELSHMGFIDPAAKWDNDQWSFAGNGIKSLKEAQKAHSEGNGGPLWAYNNQDDYYRLTPSQQLDVDQGLDPARGGKRKGGGLFQGPVENGPVWHSAVAKAVESTKQDKNSPQAWLALLSKTPGVKAEEIEWLGLKEWLGEQKGSVSRQQVADFVKANQIEVAESVRGGPAGGVGMFENGVTPLELGNKIRDAYRALVPGAENIQQGTDDQNEAENIAFEGYGAFHRGAIQRALIAFEDAARRDPKWAPVEALMAEAWKERVEQSETTAAGKTRFDSYKLGGEKDGTYREIVFSAPGTPSEDFESSHFGKGALAHARISEHETSDGKPLFFVEEIQSDLHQKGREDGYADPGARAALKAAMDASEERATIAFADHRINDTSASSAAVDEALSVRDAARSAFYSGTRKAPPAPFKSSWEEMVAKRMLRMAAEQGFDQLGWTTGEQQADRYDLAQKVQSVTWNQETGYLSAMTPEFDEAVSKQNVKAEDLPGIIGEAAAKKLIAAEETTEVDRFGGSYRGKTIRGLDLQVGGEGMKSAYDQRIPKIFEKLVKKHGGKVEKKALANMKEQTSPDEVWTVTIPETLRKLVLAEGLPLFAGPADNPRGSVQHIRQGLRDVFRIAVNPTADLSTFLHESGHVFLELFADLAARPDAPEQVKKDWAQTLAYLGPALTERSAEGWSFTREQHEKWADSFLAYLREGKAPSAELRSSFKRFSDWLKEIYKSVRQLGVELSPEIRGVFDRLLATDDEIDTMRRAMGKPLFGSLAEALAAGLSPGKYAEWLDDQEAANSSAERAAKLRIKAEELRKKDKQWKVDLEAEETAAEAEYDALPAVKAQLILSGKGTDEYLGLDMALDRAAVEAAVGAAAARKFRLAKEGGVNPDDLAGDLGFATGAEMLKAIEVLPPRDVWAKKRAEWQMGEKHPGVMEDREQLRELVGKGLHGDETERSLLKEIEALTARAPDGSRPVEAIALAARQMVERTPVGKLNATRALLAERRAANIAVKALAKGNFGEVLVQKHRQLLAMYMYRELQKAREERAAFVDLSKDLAKDKARAKIGQGSPVLRDAIDFVLEAFGLKEARAQGVPPGDLAAAKQLMEEDGTAVVDLDEVKAILAKLGQRTWEDLPLSDMRTVRKALENIRGAGRLRGTVMLDEKRATRADVVEQTVAAIDQQLVKKPAGYGGSSSSNTVGETVFGLYNSFNGSLLRPTTLLGDLAGGDVNSIIHRAFIDPLRKAKHLEADLAKSVMEPVIDAFEAVPKEVRARFREKVDGAKLFPNHSENSRPPRFRYELLMMLANSGNAGNLQRLLGGTFQKADGTSTIRGRNIAPSELLAALNVLTKVEIDYVQSILDAHEKPVQMQGEEAAKSLKERAFELEERITGLRPEAVVATPVILANGTLRGGYFPAVYDRQAEQAGERQVATTLASLSDPTYTRPGTDTGYLQKRVPDFTGVLSLEPGTIYSHLNKTIHDIAFREPLASVGSLVLDPKIDQALKRYLGDGKARQFLPWLKDIGSSNSALDPALGFLNKTISFVRGNMAPAILGWKATVALGDIGNLPAAVAATPLKAKYLAAGLSTFLQGRSAARAFALEMSGELRHQQDTLQRDFARNVKDLTSRWRNLKALGPLAWWKDHAFFFMETSQAATATPIWIGAYQQAWDAEQNHEAAAKFADNILAQVFPSHSAVDQSAILRSKGFWGLSTVFYGYMNTAYNMQHVIARPLFDRAFAEAGGKDRAKKVAVVSGSMLALWISAGALSELFSGRGPESGDDDDEPSDDPLLANLARKRNWLVRKTAFAPLTLTPFGAISKRLEDAYLGKPQTPGGGNLIEQYAATLGEGFMAAADGDADTTKRLLKTAGALGMLLGQPTSPFRMGGKYIADALSDDGEQSPADVASGVVYGRRDKQPENPITFVTGQ